MLSRRAFVSGAGLRRVVLARLVVLERSRYSIFVNCSRTTKCTRNLFLNNRAGHEYPHFGTSLDGCAILDSLQNVDALDQFYSSGTITSR